MDLELVNSAVTDSLDLKRQKNKKFCLSGMFKIHTAKSSFYW